MDKILKKIDKEIAYHEKESECVTDRLEKCRHRSRMYEAKKIKHFILSQQKENKGSVIIALSEGEYIHRCLNCNHQIKSISGSLNFCPTCGKAVEPLHMASGEIVIREGIHE